MTGTNRRYVGRISDSATAKNAALQVAVQIIDDKLEVTLNEDEQWTWEMSEVSMNRVAIDRFQIKLADEQLYFLPVDPMAFAADVFERYTDSPDEPFKGFLRRRIEAAQSDDDEDEDDRVAA